MFSLPFQETYRRGQRPCFELRTTDGYHVRLFPNLVRGIGNRVKIEAGETATFSVVLEGEASPLVRPGAFRIFCRYAARWAQRVDASEMERLALETPQIEVRAHGRDNAALRKALREGGRERAAAIAELVVRKDLAVLPVLREFAKDADMAPIAIQRIGDAALPQDFETIAAALKHPLRAVRKLAVLALGNYSGSRARRALLRMIWDEELKTPAVEALCKHKHKRTVSAFIVLLRDHDGPWTKRIKDQLYEWTGLNVEPSDVGAFELWFKRKLKNGEPWDRPNK